MGFALGESIYLICRCLFDLNAAFGGGCLNASVFAQIFIALQVDGADGAATGFQRGQNGDPAFES